MTKGFVGNQRAGKTLSAIMEALEYQEKVERDYQIPTSIYANFPCNFQYIAFEDWQELLEIKNAIVIFDEIDTAIDSRNFKSKDQMRFTHWFKQNGKKGITLLYTAQKFDLVEKRVREQTEFVLKCAKNYITGKLHRELLDMRGVSDIEMSTVIKNDVIHDPVAWYDLFNSFAVVKTTLKA